MKISILKHFENLMMSFFVIAITFLLTAIDLGQIGTYVLIPFAFLIYFFGNNRVTNYVLSKNTVKYYIFFFIISSLSILYSIDKNIAILTQRRMFIVLLFSLTVFSYSIKSFKNIITLYKTNAFLLFLLFFYISTLGIDLSESNRAEDSVLNANTYGYFIFNGLFSLFILYNSSKPKTKLRYIIFALTIIGSIYSFQLVLISASRGASIIISLLIIGNIFITFFLFKKGFLKKFFFLAIIFFGFIYLLEYLNSNYLKDSFLVQRFDLLDENGTPREFHVKKAIEIGLENPILGVGAGNYAIIPKSHEQGSFSHNTYAEIFANFGLFGVLSYLIFIFSIFLKIKRLHKFLAREEKIVVYQILLYLFIFIIYSTLYVVYLSAVFMHFLFMIYAHLLVIKKRKLNIISI